MRRTFLCLAALGFVGTAGLSGWAAHRLGWAVHTIQPRSDPSYIHGRAWVSGAHRTDIGAIRSIISEPTSQAWEQKKALEALAWVETAQIRRLATGEALISLTEKQPFAIWQNEGQLRLVEKSGAVIGPADLKQFGDLPLLVGPGAPAKAADLIAALDSSEALSARVYAAVRLGDRRWDILFRCGIRLMLPDDGDGDWKAAWQHFVSLQKEHRLLDREITHVDLRQQDRVRLRLTSRGKALLDMERRQT